MLQLSKAFMKKKEKMIFINEMIVRIIKKIFRKASRNYQLKNETGINDRFKNKKRKIHGQ